MHGLTVRWSLEHAAPGVDAELTRYVAETSHARFTGKAGLRFKTWRSRAGEWFEGCYVFESTDEREAFETDFRAKADDSPVSQIVGAGPTLIEPCDVVAVAAGGSGFLAAPTYD